jgi:putative ABC transport system permease protein
VILGRVAAQIGTEVRLDPLVLIAAAALTMLMAMASGLAALRSFQGVDPAVNIR